tara:strand:- start:22 stop:189 length:168 start_codon:yes stop_codon:yes gene_type:complete
MLDRLNRNYLTELNLLPEVTTSMILDQAMINGSTESKTWTLLYRQTHSTIPTKIS